MKIWSLVAAAALVAAGANAFAEEKKPEEKKKTVAPLKAPADAKKTESKPEGEAKTEAKTERPKAAPLKAPADAKTSEKPSKTTVAEPKKTDAAESAAEAPAAAGDVSVEAKVCKNLQDRQPVDVTDVFKVSDGQVHTWSRVSGAAGSEIHHVYFHGDQQVDDITLKIGGSPWRTNSRKTLRPDAGMEGDWRVEIRDASGAVIETLKFSVE